MRLHNGGGVILSLLFACRKDVKAILRPYYREVKTAVEPYYLEAKYSCQFWYMTKYKKEFPDTIGNNPWQDKKVLVIGDSQSAHGEWQAYLSKYLDCNVKTHAQGGARMLQLVNGERYGFDDKIPSEREVSMSSTIDPNKFGVEEFKPLCADEVRNADLIIVMGLYNEAVPFTYDYGSRSDLYPKHTTFCGRFNYMITRIREVLKNAGNDDCQIMVTNMHRCGSNAYLSMTSYDYGDAYTDSLKLLCRQNQIQMLDIMHECPIDSTNWSYYQLSTYLTAEESVLRPLADKTRPDYLHLNSHGHLAVASTIARLLSK